MLSYGLLTSTKDPVPPCSGSVVLLLRGFVADVACELHYRNEEAGPVEAVFVFPLDAEAAVYAFQAHLGGTCVEAQLHERGEARELYEDAMVGGYASFLLEEAGVGGDVFSCILGNLPPGAEATLTLRYVCELPREPDGAARFVLPIVLRPRYAPQGWVGEDVIQGVPRAPSGELPYTLSLSATLESPLGVERVVSNCPLTPLSYPGRDRSSAQVSLAQQPPWDRDVELLVYYAEPHKPSAVLEAGLPGAEPGSLMGDPALMVTLMPNLLEATAVGEFIFLLDCSGSMNSTMDARADSPTRIDSAKETLILLLKSLPMGCYFNIYCFGSQFESFYPQSVEYTQQTMAKSLKRVRWLRADLGGTEILAPLEAIYCSPCRDGHPRQLFVFTDGEVCNTEEVIDEVQRHWGSCRCFSFGIGEGASTALIKGIAWFGGGSAEFITGQDRMQPKALQSLKRALQRAVTGIMLSWDLPPGMEAELLGPAPEVIFPGKRCLIYAQLRGQPPPPGAAVGGVTLQYCIREQSYKETLVFPLQPQAGDRLPVHRLAAKALLLELEGAVRAGLEGAQRRALEASLSSGVICSLTAYLGVDTARGQPVQGPMVRRDIPIAGTVHHAVHHLRRRQLLGCSAIRRNLQHLVVTCYWHLSELELLPRSSLCFRLPQKCLSWLRCIPDRLWGRPQCRGSASSDPEAPPEPVPQKERAAEESPLLRLVSLQNADGSWDLGPPLVAALGVSMTDARGRKPSEDVAPSVWATVLAVVWLHGRATGQRYEWELLAVKAVGWVRNRAGPWLSECLEAANALLGCNVDPAIFGL